MDQSLEFLWFLYRFNNFSTILCTFYTDMQFSSYSEHKRDKFIIILTFSYIYIYIVQRSEVVFQNFPKICDIDHFLNLDIKNIRHLSNQSVAQLIPFQYFNRRKLIQCLSITSMIEFTYLISLIENLSLFYNTIFSFLSFFILFYTNT